jgi:hypothetical protein
MWSCPKCQTKVDDAFEVCWQCGTTADGVEDPTFVSADETPPIEDPIYDPVAQPDPGLGVPPLAGHAPGDLGEVVDIYQAFSVVEAKFLADQLVAAGIPAMSDTMDMQDALGTMSGQPKVYVRTADAERAAAWLADYDRNKQGEIERHLDRS